MKSEKLLSLSIQTYKDLLSSYPEFDLNPEARVGIANSYLALRQYELAKQEAWEVIHEHPATFAAQESKKLLNKIDAITG